MSKKRGIGKTAIVILIVLLIIGSGLALVPNPISKRVIAIAKANGYVQYEPMEAYNLAHYICTQCHELERIKRYCPRCGPPFVAVVPHMQSFIDNYKVSKPELKISNITEDQAVAIVQVWNATVGNWEGDFREQDIKKLVGKYHKLFALYKTPVDERPIESVLAGRSDLKIGTNIVQAVEVLETPTEMKNMDGDNQHNNGDSHEHSSGK